MIRWISPRQIAKLAQYPRNGTVVHRFPVYPGILAHLFPQGACTESINYIPQNFL